jgi:hypothetical protein
MKTNNAELNWARKVLPKSKLTHTTTARDLQTKPLAMWRA